MPCNSEVAPPPTNGSFTTTASKNAANASVAIATHTRPSRTRGTASSPATAAAIAAPTNTAAITFTSKRSANWNTVNPPIAANAPWHSEIWPANPVITVTDRKTMLRITVWVTRNIHCASALVNTTRPTTAKNTTPAINVARVRSGLRLMAAGGGGGGDTPDSGST